LRQELGRSSDGLPGLAQIPILGALFASQNFQKRQSELVIFVTPELHIPSEEQKVEMPKGWVRDEL
jgi:pilus assembly protein CpaC